DDRLLRALTGLNIKAFEELKLAFEQELLVEEVPRRSQEQRQRAKGAGRKPRLETVEEKLMYILFYFKCYPTFDLAGIIFDLDRSQANRWMHRLQLVLEKALGRKMALPKRKLKSIEEFIESFPEVKRVILDGTERPIQRAKDQEKQKQDYSGKKKRHTRTHLGAVAPDKSILVLSKAYHGKDHDKGILNREKWVDYVPGEVKIQGDLGFQGLQNEYVNVEIPHKKPKGGELTNQQKEENRGLASERVVCEHAFAGVKRYGIATDVYRNRIKDFDDHSMFTAAGLWNFYLMAA
ncbi:MAG: transposase family protein, partial [Cyanobacteria bacterium P01_F01_bin.143]